MRITRRAWKILIGILITLVAIVLIAVLAFIGLRVWGKNSIYDNTFGEVRPNLEGVPIPSEGGEPIIVPVTPEEEEQWQEGDIRYGEDIYRYNADILTFLVMGIDRTDKVPDPKKVKDYTKGGQADAMFLVALNPHTKNISLIAINRNTMTDIEMYRKDGSLANVSKAQIALQFGYGDGSTLSCERTTQAVSNLFYQLPIHGYAAINMGAISLINDQVGGVEVSLLEQIPKGSQLLRQDIGTKVLLKGEDAFWYVKYRDYKQYNTVEGRMKRDKQYISAYAAKAKEKTKADITFPVSVYNNISKYMTTSITVPELTYLAPELLDYSFDQSHIYTIDGKVVMGEVYEEYYIDEASLMDLIIRVFYEKVN